MKSASRSLLLTVSVAVAIGGLWSLVGRHPHPTVSTEAGPTSEMTPKDRDLRSILNLTRSENTQPRLCFQARLADEDGEPLVGRRTLEFRFYDAPVGGAPLPNCQPLAVVVDMAYDDEGLVSIDVPSQSGAAFDAALCGLSARYLGVTVDGGAELTPRLLLSAIHKGISGTALNGNNEPEAATTGSLTVVAKPANQAWRDDQPRPSDGPDAAAIGLAGELSPNDLNTNCPGWFRTPGSRVSVSS